VSKKSATKQILIGAGSGWWVSNSIIRLGQIHSLDNGFGISGSPASSLWKLEKWLRLRSAVELLFCN
jgi:hypothetical protein